MEIIMKRSKQIQSIRSILGLTAGLFLGVIGSYTGQAYSTYGGGSSGSCVDCHGDFRGSTSPQGTVFPSSQNHEMHRASTSMATACNLCHTGSSRTPVYISTSNGTANNTGLGCSGCHVGAGLRAHHVNNGVIVCLDCHDPETSVPENVKPPYYGTADTKVKNPGNTARVANTNENWSVGDFLGLDNDGNNLYDLADYAIGPYRLLGAVPEGNNFRITWLTAGGRANTLQAAPTPTGPFSNISSAINIPGVGLVTTNYVEVGGANRGARFYRLQSQVP
jgi:hypothetical protein